MLWGIDEGKRTNAVRGGRTTVRVSVLHTCRCNVVSGNGGCLKQLLRSHDVSWAMSMALLDMLVRHDLSVLRIALL